jgi:hypothetical protein
MICHFIRLRHPAPRRIVDIQFHLRPDAFFELMGDAGIIYGSGYATYKEVTSSKCLVNNG